MAKRGRPRKTDNQAEKNEQVALKASGVEKPLAELTQQDVHDIITCIQHLATDQYGKKFYKLEQIQDRLTANASN